MQESELMQRAIAHDSAAFEALITPYEARMYSVCLRYMRNGEDAKDCLQEAMLRIYRSLKDFKGDSSLYTWVYKVTCSVCLDELRRRKKHAQVSLDALVTEGYSPSATDVSSDPERKLLSTQQRAQLIRYLKDMDEDMSVPILYRDVSGYTYEEIARILDLNLGTVKSRISRGRQKLREKILENRELFDI